MSNPSDDGSWTPQGQDPYGQQEQHGQQAPEATPGQEPWAQPPAQDPYGQASPYGQPSPYGQASPYGAPPDAQSSAGQPSAGQPSPYGAPGGAGQGPYDASGAGQAPYGAPAPQPGGEPQSRVLVGILGIFLGGFGVHRFLLGYTTIGIIQIVVTVLTCGLGAWWGVIEGIMVLAKAQTFERDAHGRPLKD